MNEWRIKNFLTTISSQCHFCLPGTCKIIKHKFNDARNWNRTPFITMESSDARVSDEFHLEWKHNLSLMTTSGSNLITWFEIWYFLRGIIMWTIWIEHNDIMFNRNH